MKLPPRSKPEEREFFITRMLNDTGFFCRNVLGMNTDRDPTGKPVSEEGAGGIREDGPHGDTIRFLDDESKQYKVLWTPRFTYKSSKVTGYILRNILKYPDISILLCMHTTEEAEGRVQKIRDLLTTNEIILEVFGDLTSQPWQEDRFVTALRTDRTLLTPTLYAASPQKGTAGGRPDLIVYDDIVSETNSVTEVQLAKGCRFVEASLALRGQRTRFVGVGTPYHEKDANHWMVDAGWHRLIHLDAGVDVSVNDKGIVELEGEGRWPNLPIDFLQKYLRNPEKHGGGGSYEWFMSQFKLQVVRGLHARFQRTHFQPERWQDSHSDLTGYLLCDTAPSGNTDGDMNVLMYVGIDERHRVHILDLEVGYWQMYEFCDRYLKMLQRWQAKVNHRLEVWEQGHTFFSYFQHIQVQGKQRNIRVSVHKEPRNNTVKGKDDRIAGTAIRFQAMEVFVTDTVPKVWNAGTDLKELWNPVGEIDGKTGFGLPGGELVQQFVRFPASSKKDIPDAFSLVDAIDKDSQQRVCFHVKSGRRQPSDAIDRKPIRPAATKYHGSSSRFYRNIRERQSLRDQSR